MYTYVGIVRETFIRNHPDSQIDTRPFLAHLTVANVIYSRGKVDQIPPHTYTSMQNEEVGGQMVTEVHLLATGGSDLVKGKQLGDGYYCLHKCSFA